MMIPTGGPFYPIAQFTDEGKVLFLQRGVSFRNRCAMEAMKEFLKADIIWDDVDKRLEEIAGLSFRMADMMVKRSLYKEEEIRDDFQTEK